MKYISLGIPSSYEEITKKTMPRIIESYKDNSSFGIFAAFLNHVDEFIGWFQFEIDEEIKDAIEIGWRLKKQYWGNGYATEVAIALSDKGVEMGKKIVARSMIENIASIRVMEKAGLKLKNEFWGDYQPHSGHPDVLYIRSPNR
tara:strand:- start:682 stop:1113 length:432 start_codon:yes stop_codon:yes gene_type:complete